MRFSVIVPAYNAERTLPACLESVKSQTYPDFEVIVIDDGSLDETGKIAKAYADADERFHYIRQENAGVSASRNQGLRAAVGEFVVFLDSDDRYEPDYLQEFHRLIQSNPTCDHFWCGYQTVDSTGGYVGQSLWADADGKTQMLDRSQIMELHERALDAALWNKAYRRCVIAQYDIKMRESLSLGEDQLFNYHYLDVCRPQIVMQDSPLYLYTKAENGTLDSKYRADLRDIYALIDDTILTYLKKWEVSGEQLKKYYNSVFYMQERILRNTFRPECMLSRTEKYQLNRDILESEKFRTALRESDCSIHPLYRFGYEAGSWRMIQILDKLVKIKNRVRR